MLAMTGNKFPLLGSWIKSNNLQFFTATENGGEKGAQGILDFWLGNISGSFLDFQKSWFSCYD